jgi:hypothetical protein
MLAVLPATSVDCERGFSNLNRVKNNARNKLKEKHLESLMRTSTTNMSAKAFVHYKSLLIARWNRACARRTAGKGDIISQ